MSNQEDSQENLVEEIEYKSRKIAIVQKEGTHQLRLGNEPRTVERDADTATYHSPDLPYMSFASLQELGKAMVDQGLAGAADDE